MVPLSTPGLRARVGGVLRSWRLWQIRRAATVFAMVDRIGPIARLVRAARSWSLARSVLDGLVGYRREFPSLAEARSAAAPYFDASLATAEMVDRHIALGRAARPSDYPILFYLNQLMTDTSTLFDLGGNAGNLLYCYSNYIGISHNFRWTVCDLPEVMEFGRRLARERGESRIRFEADATAMSGHDILLASGSLHYLDSSLAEILRGISVKPKHVFINRCPISDATSLVTVQDVGHALFACRIIARRDLIAGMEELGYELIDRWDVPELSIRIPFHPEDSVGQYSGLYLRLRCAT